MTIVSSILAQPGERTAVIYGKREISYAELASDIHRAAAYLRDCGLAGKIIGIHLGPPQTETDYPTWIAHLAAMRIGAEHVSITKGVMLDRLPVKLDALVGRIPEDATSKLKLVVPFDLDSMPDAADSADDEANAARLSPTSGTTGEPKLIRWDAATMAERVAQAAEVGEITADSRVGSALTLRTTAGFRYPLATWCAGGCVLLSNRVRDEMGRPAIFRSSLLVCSPFQLASLVKNGRPWPGKEDRTVAVLGGRVPPALREWALANLGTEVLNSYGSTEVGNIAHGDAALASRHPGAVGYVRKGLELRIVGDKGKPVAAGTPGRIQVRSAARPKAGEKKPEWFEPGDIGLLFDDGLLAIEGRDAEIVNVGGMKVAAGEIETEMRAISGVADVGISVVDTSAGEAIAVAILPDGQPQLQALLPSIRPLLPAGAEFKMFFIGAIPRNDMGKIDRPKLADSVRLALNPPQPQAKVDA